LPASGKRPVESVIYCSVSESLLSASGLLCAVFTYDITDFAIVSSC